MPPRRGRSRPRADKTPAEERGIAIRGIWQTSDAPVLFANQVFVRLQDDYVLITFGQVELPREVEITEETRQKLVAEGLPIQTVVRLAVTPTVLSQMIKHLTTIQNRWLEREQQRETS